MLGDLPSKILSENFFNPKGDCERLENKNKKDKNEGFFKGILGKLLGGN